MISKNNNKSSIAAPVLTIILVTLLFFLVFLSPITEKMKKFHIILIVLFGFLMTNATFCVKFK
jgi:hypothetical protein